MMDMYDTEDLLHDAGQFQPMDTSQTSSNDVENTLSTFNSLSQAASDAKNVTKD